MYYNMIITAIVLAAASGVPGLLLPRTSAWGQRTAAVMMSIGALAGLFGAASELWAGRNSVYGFPWPAAGNPLIGVDAMSAFFLLPIFLMGGLGSIYGLGYWPQTRKPGSGRRLQFFWGLLTAGLALLAASKHAMAFLFGWEMMALSAFFLVAVEDYRPECRLSAWLYLIATHIGTLSLFAMFGLWRWTTGSYVLQPVPAGVVGAGVMNVLFLLSLIGFGLKAGMMPLHFWLPGAHAAAPSHVSAMLSGVVLKMGIYGLLRFFFLFPDPPSFWGGLVLLMGAVSGLLGVVFAIGQHDLKRLLAYHSVENIGIILMGMGLAMLGRSAGRPEWTVLGLAGCLLHVWNHSLFKSLLFFGAGSVLHGTGTRMIDHLGGLAGSMKWTSALFFIGAMAICGLPPLNGFVSELFVYLGLFRTMTGPGTGGPAAVIAVPVLAMIGALALACFVKVYGTVFLGTPRTFASEGARESPYTMLAPMAVLAAACALIGAAPVLVSPVLEKVIAAWMPAGPGSIPLRLDTLAPLRMVGLMSVLLIGGTAMLMIFSFFLGRPRRRVPTWDCGYARPTGRMQYTASSFARTIVTIFGWVLRPLVHRPHIDTLFPVTAAMNSHVDDAVLDRFLLPAVHGLERRFGWFHRFQQGLTQHYMFYLLVTVVLMLSTLLPFKEIAAFLGLR